MCFSTRFRNENEKHHNSKTVQTIVFNEFSKLIVLILRYNNLHLVNRDAFGLLEARVKRYR